MKNYNNFFTTSNGNIAEMLYIEVRIDDNFNCYTVCHARRLGKQFAFGIVSKRELDAEELGLSIYNEIPYGVVDGRTLDEDGNVLPGEVYCCKGIGY